MGLLTIVTLIGTIKSGNTAESVLLQRGTCVTVRPRVRDSSVIKIGPDQKKIRPVIQTYTFKLVAEIAQ
jgi:hypothetical protein